MAYNYEANSNKLISVADAGTDASFPKTGGAFTYDANGNQTNYLPRGIPSITYNILNLVNTVSITGKGTQNYTYAADDTKLGFRQASAKIKSYIGAVEYDGAGNVARIGTEEGYILKRTGWNENSKDSKFVYYYSVKDHLGNVRLVLDDESNAKLWQRNDYQAFGMHINQPVDGVPLPELTTINDRYYNGKEYDDQTTWLDYGARQYDYSLNKWMSVDPAHEDGGQESFTPYGYVFDNPMKYTDPDGRLPCCGELLDFLHGTADAVASNATPISRNVVNSRGSYSYDAGVQAGQVLSIITGVIEVGAGLQGYAAAGGGEILSGGTLTAPALGVAAVSTGMIANGLSTIAKGIKNLNSEGGNNQGGDNSSGNTGRGKNHLEPDKTAKGDHSTFRTDPQTGKTTNTATYEKNPRNPNGFQETKRVDVKGGGHKHSKTGENVPTPHVHDAKQKDPRPARPDELPRQ